MKLYEFNPGSTQPLFHLAHANGFPPPTYQGVVATFLSDYHVLSLLARPLWGETPAEWLRNWFQLSEDLRVGLKGLGAQKITAVGHSLGGVMTLYAAVNQPELFGRIVLIDPTMLPPRLLWQIRWMRLWGGELRPELVEGALRRRREWESVEAAYQSFKGKPLFKKWPDGVIRAYTESMTAPVPEGGVRLVYPPEWEARIYQTIPTDVWGYAKRLTQPTLVIRGAESNTFTEASEKAFRRANPKVTFASVLGAGHLVAQERPAEVAALIADFLKKPPVL